MFIKVLDVNDNAPEFATSYDTFVCENVKAGQVRRVSGAGPLGTGPHHWSLTSCICRRGHQHDSECIQDSP